MQENCFDTFEELYHGTYSDVSKYVVCHCSNIGDVEDLLQIIYLDVYQYFSSHKDISKAYIMGIAKHKLQDYYRSFYKRKISSLFLSFCDLTWIDRFPDNIDLEDSILKKYDVEKVWNYLKRKKPIISKIFYLYYNLDLTIPNIAKELGITESNVKHYLYRTIAEIRKYMKEEGGYYGK